MNMLDELYARLTGYDSKGRQCRDLTKINVSEMHRLMYEAVRTVNRHIKVAREQKGAQLTQVQRRRINQLRRELMNLVHSRPGKHRQETYLQVHQLCHEIEKNLEGWFSTQ